MRNEILIVLAVTVSSLGPVGCAANRDDDTFKDSDRPSAQQEGTDIFVEGEAVYSFREGYKPPEAAAPYLLDITQIKLLGMKDWVAAQGEFEKVRGDWQQIFQYAFENILGLRESAEPRRLPVNDDDHASRISPRG